MDIAVAMADGSGTTMPASDPLDECSPSWSPDGEQVAFLCGSYPNVGSTGVWEYDLYVVHADGTGLRQVAAPKFGPMPLVWSPDQTRIRADGLVDFQDPAIDDPVRVVTLDGSHEAVTVLRPTGTGGVSSWQRLAP